MSGVPEESGGCWECVEHETRAATVLEAVGVHCMLACMKGNLLDFRWSNRLSSSAVCSLPILLGYSISMRSACIVRV